MHGIGKMILLSTKYRRKPAFLQGIGVNWNYWDEVVIALLIVKQFSIDETGYYNAVIGA